MKTPEPVMNSFALSAMAEPSLTRMATARATYQALKDFVVQPDDQPGIPPQALILGVAGVLPFIGLTFSGLALPHLQVPGLRLYAAVILSFMGGVQWGLSIGSPVGQPAWRRYGASVLPALIAWSSFVLSSRDGLMVLAVAFLGLLGYDLWTALRGEAPMWYGRLRLVLTVAVISCLIVAVPTLPA